MAYLKLLFLLLFLSCAVEGPDPYYKFEVWEQDHMIRVSYCSDFVGYTLLVGCTEESVQQPETAMFVKKNTLKGYSEYAFFRECEPMWFRVIEPIQTKAKKI